MAKLFAGIFITLTPLIAILRAGRDGHLAAVVAAVTGADGQPLDTMYFWMTGVLSSFLDNAPTYLVFFNLASGDAQVMMERLPQTLLAISMSSVFMGAMTYVGNAPNFMVKAIAEQRGVKMPSFFGYLLWSCAVLLPLLAVLQWVMLKPPVFPGCVSAAVTPANAGPADRAWAPSPRVSGRTSGTRPAAPAGSGRAPWP